MLGRRKVSAWFTVGLIIAWPLALWGADAELQEPKNPIARLVVQPARIDWLPEVDYESLVLTVAGPGDLYIRREFAFGETPFFSPLDALDGRLLDGTYAYELRAVPRQVVNGLRKGAEPSENPLVQSGYLWVQGGSFMDADAVRRDPSDPGASTKPPAPSTTVKTTVPDDLIVQAQACIGSGCVNGDGNVAALKLKELFDTRITFENDGCCHPSTHNWALQANEFATNSGDFMIRDLTVFPSTTPFRIGANSPDNAFKILSNNGNIGLGTSTPAVRLHVLGSVGTNKVLVEEASGTAAARELLEIRNKGGSFQIFEDTTVPERWGNGTFGSSFVIDNQANAGFEFIVTNTGNVTIAGTLTQGSSRDLKIGLAALDPKDVLARVSALPVSSWSYKTEDAVRHVGPMAEDFHQAFGLGADDKHIAPGDQAGVALLAVQGLQQVVAEKDADIAELKSRIETLEKLVQDLVQEKPVAEAE